PDQVIDQAKDQASDEARDEARRKFREALDRKRATEADTDGGRADTKTGPVHSAHGPARNRRSFRRKSG
ncbi:MAG: DUF5302 domain-containing protein, partial [Streptosporangiaceae bacterium]